MPIDCQSYSRAIVLTGAGVSAASGLKTYRGPDGIWNDGDLARLSLVDALKASPAEVWRAFGPMRTSILQARPNAAHLALARWEASLSAGQELLIVTQNIDGLHATAGTRALVEIHGNMMYTRCIDDACTFPRTYDEQTHVDALPVCPVCGNALRPDVVFFGEYPAFEHSHRIKKALRDCDLFLAIGTSGVVSPAAEYVRGADYAGARTVYINLEPMDPPNRYFREQHIGKAEQLLPELLRVGA